MIKYAMMMLMIAALGVGCVSVQAPNLALVGSGEAFEVRAVFIAGWTG